MNADQRHHAERIRRNMDQTMENIVHTNNCIVYAEDKKVKSRLKAKNDQRIAALERMKQSLPN
ncbi:MAG: hypothetical protein FWE19_07265 [Oscillospiraceae bacterium]|nr:hypothetical protein [Oscillospiraceae bacterium]